MPFIHRVGVKPFLKEIPIMIESIYREIYIYIDYRLYHYDNHRLYIIMIIIYRYNSEIQKSSEHLIGHPICNHLFI